MGDLFTIRVAGNVIESSLEIQKDEEYGLRVFGAIYHIENGTVDFDV